MCKPPNALLKMPFAWLSLFLTLSESMTLIKYAPIKIRKPEWYTCFRSVKQLHLSEPLEILCDLLSLFLGCSAQAWIANRLTSTVFYPCLLSLSVSFPCVILVLFVCPASPGWRFVSRKLSLYQLSWLYWKKCVLIAVITAENYTYLTVLSDTIK